MLKRLLLFLVLLPAFAAQSPPEVSFKAAAKAGILVLPPGPYQVTVRGSVVFFTDPAGKSYSTVVRIEKLPEKVAATAVMGETVENRFRVAWIVLRDADFRIIF